MHYNYLWKVRVSEFSLQKRCYAVIKFDFLDMSQWMGIAFPLDFLLIPNH